MITVLPPTVEEIQLWCGRAVSVSLPTGPFESPLRVAEGTDITLVARRRGYADVIFQGVAVRDNAPVSLERFPSDAWWKHIDKEDFRVVDDHDGTYLADADVKPTDGKWVRSERDLGGVEVKVRVNGYEPFCRRCDLTLAPPYVIKVSRCQQKVTLPVELDNGRVGQMMLKGVDISEANPRLAGYTLSQGRLVYTPPAPEARSPQAPAVTAQSSSRLSFVTGFLSGLLAAGIAMLCYLIFFL